MSKLLKMNYHPQLIDIMIKSTPAGTFSVNILTPFLISFLFFDYIDNTHVYIWLFANLVIFMMRIVNVKELNTANSADIESVNRVLSNTLCIIFFSALLHAYALWYSSFYLSSEQLFFMALVTVSLVSGSISTIGSVFYAFAVYVIFNLLPIIFVFTYHGGEMYYVFSFSMLVYMLVMLKSGYRQFSVLEESILLKESFEIRVQAAVEELKNQEKLLYQQSRLAQMGEMLSMIAHQWRQPLNAISATSASLNLKAKLDKVDNESVLTMTDNISEYSQHLSETIDDFRNFFKPNKERVETSFIILVDAALKILNPSTNKHNITIIKEYNSEDTFVSYSNELKHVILNILKNAEDALLEREIQDAYIKIVIQRDNSKIILKIMDNARGISEEILGSIFTPYFSTKKKKEGTGLGLYMSKIIIQEHCLGDLEVYNDTEGAVFRISLNLGEEV